MSMHGAPEGPSSGAQESCLSHGFVLSALGNVSQVDEASLFSFQGLQCAVGIWEWNLEACWVEEMVWSFLHLPDAGGKEAEEPL